MKKIEAIIRRTKFEEVKEALLAADIEWFSYYEVRGVGKTREGRIYRGVVYDTSSIERILISIVVREKNVEKPVPSVSVQANVAIFRFIMRNRKNNPGKSTQVLILKR